MDSKAEATKAGKELLKKVKGNWKLRVWENLGWHYALYNKDHSGLNLYVSEGECIPKGNTYSCMLSSTPGDSGGEMYWTDNYHSKDPNKAVEHQIKVARKFVDKLNKVMRKLEKVGGNN